MKRRLLPMNLQFFAEENGAGTDTGSNSTGTTEENTNQEKQTFDDILSNKEYQAEFDRRIQKAIATAITGEKEKWETLMDDKVSEAEKLAKMNKEEKAAYSQKKREEELSRREAEITKKELAAEAKNTLAAKGIPASLADILVYTDAESCKHSVSILETAWQEAIEQAVQERLKGGKPPKRAQDEDSSNNANSFVDVIKQNQSKR